MTSIVVRSELWRGGQLPPSQRRSTDSSRILPDPSHEVQTNGGLADDWYLDDGDVLCDARLVNAYLTCFDRCNPSVGGERNITKTEVIYYVDEQALQSHAVDWQLAAVDWQLAAVRATATVRTAEQPGLTLGVVTGSIEDIEAQLCQKSDVVRAIQRQGVPKAEAERRARDTSSVDAMEDELVRAHYTRDGAIFATRGVETVGGRTGGYDQLARGHAAWSVNLEGSS